ncbi:hypothetical protein BN1723_002175 [Verticillium longisporum]|uniref:Clr5 domain-containing protein n=1 Tax=Verticillium longisporum TaxID=100787 RepID=A0A0G4KZ08_VERLO|nr:hypothetical protein BN1723_002175 [Verticillium longisporum]CRK21104.1 hypothetical protein BN1708_003441 [Verticillium longisporum]
MAGKPSYTRKQIEFVLIHILDKVALHRIIEAFKETFSQDVTIGQIKYLKSKYGKDPDYGSPLLEGRVRIVEEMATLRTPADPIFPYQPCQHFGLSQTASEEQNRTGHVPWNPWDGLPTPRVPAENFSLTDHQNTIMEQTGKMACADGYYHARQPSQPLHANTSMGHGPYWTKNLPQEPSEHYKTLSLFPPRIRDTGDTNSSDYHLWGPRDDQLQQVGVTSPVSPTSNASDMPGGLMPNFEHWNAQQSPYPPSQQGYGDQSVQGHSCLLSDNSLSYASRNMDGPETSWDTVGSPQQGQTMPSGQLNKTQDSYQPFASRQPPSNTPRLDGLQDDPWPGLTSGAQSQYSMWPALQGSEDLPPPPYSEDHPGLGNTNTASHLSTTGWIPGGIDDSLFNSTSNSNLTPHETQALQVIIDMPQTMPDETSNSIGQCGNTLEEIAGYRSHDASPTDTGVDQHSSYSSDALELVPPTHDHAEARGVGEDWSFFDEAVAFTNSRMGSMGEHGNLDEADTLLAAAFTESERAGAYMN